MWSLFMRLGEELDSPPIQAIPALFRKISKNWLFYHVKNGLEPGFRILDLTKSVQVVESKDFMLNTGF